MVALFLALFVALACCQALFVVKLADWLSPAADIGRGRSEPVRARGVVRLA